jgi:hypothetical protein
MSGCKLLVYCSLYWGLTFTVARPDSAPPLSVIIAQVVKKADADQVALQSMEYDQATSVEELNDLGQVVHRQQRQAIVRPGAPVEMEETSVTGDKLSTDSTRKARQAAVRQNVNEGRKEFSMAKMVGRFDVTYKGKVEIAGRPAYQLAFEPKPYQKYDTQIERILDQLHGRIWVNPDNYAILQTDAHLVAPIKIGWFLATIKQLDFHYLFQGKTSHDLGPARIDIVIWIDIPVWPTIHQHQALELTNFRARD